MQNAVLTRALEQCREVGSATLVVPIQSSDTRAGLNEAEVFLSRTDSNPNGIAVSVHTGKLLGKKAHSCLDIVLSQKAATESTEDILSWISHTDLLANVVTTFYPTPLLPDSRLCRAWIYFHHICSETKVKQAMQWGTSLGLSGIMIPGEPGCLVVEGVLGGVACVVERLRLFSWRDMKVVLVTLDPDRVPWQGVRHITEECAEVYGNGARTAQGTPGTGGTTPASRSRADYSLLCEALPTQLRQDLLVVLPVFTAGLVPEVDVPFPPAQRPERSEKKKKKRLQ